MPNRLLAVNAEAAKLIKLALPVFVAQIAISLMGVTDTIMAGQVGAQDLAGVAVAQSLSITALYMQLGFFASLTPVLARIKGAGQLAQVPRTLYQALLLGCVWSALNVGFLLTAAPAILSGIHLDPGIRAVAIRYLHMLAWGVPGNILYLIMRNLVESLDNTLPSMLFGMIGLAVKLPLNYLLIYGAGSSLALGGAGCGLASSIVFWAMAAVSIIYARKVLRKNNIHWNRTDLALSPESMRLIVKIGLPLAFSIVSEVLLFTVIGLMIAPFGAAVVSGHQIAFSLSILAWLVPMSIGTAVTIRISVKLGQDNRPAAEFTSHVGVLLAILLSVVTATATWLARGTLTAWSIHDSHAQLIAGQLLMLCALYQIPDAIQVVLGGCLRGYRETEILLRGGLVAHWLLGFPIGYLLATYPTIMDHPLVPHGYWIGLLVALIGAALIFATRLRRIQMQPETSSCGMVSDIVA